MISIIIFVYVCFAILAFASCISDDIGAGGAALIAIFYPVLMVGSLLYIVVSSFIKGGRILYKKWFPKKLECQHEYNATYRTIPRCIKCGAVDPE